MKIIDYIPVGHNAVTRDQLRHLTGLGEGLIRVCRNKEKNRCQSIQGNIRAMEAALYSRKKKGIPGQMSMFGGG